MLELSVWVDDHLLMMIAGAFAFTAGALVILLRSIKGAGLLSFTSGEQSDDLWLYREGITQEEYRVSLVKAARRLRRRYKKTGKEEGIIQSLAEGALAEAEEGLIDPAPFLDRDRALADEIERWLAVSNLPAEESQTAIGSLKEGNPKPLAETLEKIIGGGDRELKQMAAYYRGQVAFACFNFGASYTWLNRAASFDLPNPAIESAAGKIAAAAGETGAAFGHLEKAAGLYSAAQTPLPEAVADCHEALSKLYLKSGEMENAKEEAQKAVTIYQESDGKNKKVGKAELLLASALTALGDYDGAKEAVDRAEALIAETCEDDHPLMAAFLHKKGDILRSQSRYEEARACYTRAITIQKKTLGKNHPATAQTHGDMGELLRYMGEYKEAERWYFKAISMDKRARHKKHPNVATRYNNLALSYMVRESYFSLFDTEPYLKKALAIDEDYYGPDHPKVARDLANIGDLFRTWGRYKEAEPYLLRAIAIDEKARGVDHPRVGLMINNLAAIYYSQKRYSEAEPLYERARAISIKTFGDDHPDIAASTHNLAELFRVQARFDEAKPLYEKALAIMEKVYGEAGHPNIKIMRRNYYALLRKEEEAKKGSGEGPAT